ncbi:hypothetical protein VTN00DRAFT_3249 [Thermoascus crustaceus]|uniref:uncharacterized protein n=1 Tax=Thermoascus crustaceus TaxID=5088 RepID=UPI003744AF64
MITTATQIEVGGGVKARQVRERSQGVPTSFSEVPIIDLSDIESVDKTKRLALASKIYDACTQVGFFYIKNHGISSSSVMQIRAEADRFFKGLTLEQKMAMDRNRSEYHLGYSPFEAEKKEGSTGARVHQFETFMFGRQAAFDRKCGARVDPKNDAENQWPKEAELPGFKDAVGSCFGEMLTLSRKLVQIFALALNLDESFFDKIDRTGSLLAMNYCAPRRLEVNMNTAIMAHTDHELFTILLQSEGVDALEIVNGDGVWVPAKPIPDAFVVNIGDALSIWTNNIFVSALHRAENGSGAERYSIPFFFGANYDVVMETLPSCISKSRPRKKEYHGGEALLEQDELCLWPSCCLSERCPVPYSRIWITAI